MVVRHVQAGLEETPPAPVSSTSGMVTSAGAIGAIVRQLRAGMDQTPPAQGAASASGMPVSGMRSRS